MTLEQFREAEEEPGYRYELGRGVLEATEVPNDPHGQIVSNLSRLIHRYADDHPGVVRRVGGGGEFRLWIAEMDSGRNPDLAVVLQGTPKDERGRRPPSLVVEVVSRGAKSETTSSNGTNTSPSGSGSIGSSNPTRAGDPAGTSGGAGPLSLVGVDSPGT